MLLEFLPCMNNPSLLTGDIDLRFEDQKVEL